MRKSFSILLSLLMCRIYMEAQGVHLNTPDYINAGTYTKSPDLFASFSNPAGLASASEFSAGAFAERKFLLTELTSFSGALLVPSKSGVFGVKLNKFGGNLYQEYRAGLFYARRLSDKLDLGAGFNYHSMAFQGYGNSSAVSIDLGAIFHFTDQLHGGMHVSNAAPSFSGKTEYEKPASLYSVGFGYDVSDKLLINAEAKKYAGFNVGVAVSLQYKIVERLLIKGGLASASSIVFFGTGFLVKDLRIDATASFHPQLGITPGLMIVYQKAKN